MLQLLALATLAVSIPTSITVGFTNDSVYKQESIIDTKEVIEQEDGLYTIIFEQDKLLGYRIYDNPETEYLDGFKFDDAFVTNYTVSDVDLSLDHTILIKTVYTDDVAGMLAAAKDGDFSRLMANPLMVIQLVYYILAALSLVAGGVGLLKAKKSKVKDHDEIASSVASKATKASEELKNEAVNLISGIVTPVCEKLQSQNQAIIEALILAQSGDEGSKLALINLLKQTATEDVTLVSDNIIKSIKDANAFKEKVKEQASKVVEKIASGDFGDNSDGNIGGLSI